MFNLIIQTNASEQLLSLLSDESKKPVSKAVVKTLNTMLKNMKHPSLKTHKYSEISGHKGEEIFESYAQNNTPGAYRIFWFYGPNKKEITILSIEPHP